MNSIPSFLRFSIIGVLLFSILSLINKTGNQKDNIVISIVLVLVLYLIDIFKKSSNEYFDEGVYAMNQPKNNSIEQNINSQEIECTTCQKKPEPTPEQIASFNVDAVNKEDSMNKTTEFDSSGVTAGAPYQVDKKNQLMNQD